MSTKEFWHCTPRKLAALAQVHADMNDTKKSKNKRKQPEMYADGVPVNPSRRAKGGVGAPNAFIDQI